MVRDTANFVNPNGTFVHGRNSDAANSSDRPYPRIHLFPFTQDRDSIETHKRTTPLLIAFVDTDSGEQDSDEREDIIARMETLLDSFVDKIEDDYATSVEFSRVRTEPQYQILEGTSGYSLSLEIKSQTGC